MSARDAAVRAVAEALVGQIADPFALVIDPGEAPAIAARALAALATSADVRAGLEHEVAGRVRWSDHDHTPRPCCIAAIVDAVLAALGGAADA